MGDLSANFSTHEFDGPVHSSLVERLQSMRDVYGKPINISSGVRTPEQNQRAGGVVDSAHLTGEACDIVCDNSRDRYELTVLALQHFNRVGIGSKFIHVDVARGKPVEVLWLYE